MASSGPVGDRSNASFDQQAVLKEQFERRESELVRSHKNQLSEIEKSHQKEIEGIKANHDEQIKQVRETSKHALVEKEAEYMNQIKKLQDLNRKKA